MWKTFRTCSRMSIGFLSFAACSSSISDVVLPCFAASMCLFSVSYSRSRSFGSKRPRGRCTLVGSTSSKRS
ncbi:hypothetical protein PF005_g17451 [Phytophthora fragariae]|uniref:Uncharacterized protein n=1 Tax=Phytophthora fragariae TaxID=53985 RepID=A0A6A3XYM2_9STRA|nr:hypothetical protein PF003_g22201 [Phytophthora fragariae]KAE8931277.1 hypothetical protein PF009_g18659 [Phytophthora fragariae]KAE8995324.1 hypothetical protein PF011_g16379 [Phytophthora fragariae]KAE9094591.1 hypothetical protein PF010_g17037 [Phytophthora fragariae]KAE9094963.1 hypothetical protein PF007_g17573 [Phytophthora fragariae]